MSTQCSHVTLWCNDDGELCAEGQIYLGFEVPEVEVTPEMIEAGLEEFTAYDDRFDRKEDEVRRIYEAMLAAAKR